MLVLFPEARKLLGRFQTRYRRETLEMAELDLVYGDIEESVFGFGIRGIQDEGTHLPSKGSQKGRRAGLAGVCVPSRCSSTVIGVMQGAGMNGELQRITELI